VSLPEIPEEAQWAAAVMVGEDTWTRDPNCGVCRSERFACPDHASASLLAAAWPAMYAAALRHAADEMWHEWPGASTVLREAADQSDPQP
jgi:hypothetical protein